MQTKQTRSLAMFLTPSIIGILIFMIPVRFRGTWTIMVKILADFISNHLETILPLLCVLILTVSSVMAAAALAGASFIHRRPLLKECFACAPVWVVVRCLGCLFAWLTFLGAGGNPVVSAISGPDHHQPAHRLPRLPPAVLRLRPFRRTGVAFPGISGIMLGCVRKAFCFPRVDGTELRINTFGGKEMKKLISLMMALAVVCALAACGSTSDAPQEENAEPAEVTETVSKNMSQEEAEQQIQVAMQYLLEEAFGDKVNDARVYVEKIYTAEEEQADELLSSLNLGPDEYAFEVKYELHPAEGADPIELTAATGEIDEESGWVVDKYNVGVLRPNTDGEPEYIITDFGTSF